MAIVPRNPTTDFTSTTLNGAIDNAVQTIAVVSAAAFQTPCYAVIDREDTNGDPTPNSREVVYVSAKNSNDLTVTRGVNNSTARSHSSGAIIEPILTVGHWADFYTAFDNDHVVGDGSHDITKIAVLSGATIQTLASKILSSPTISTPTFSGTLGSVLASTASINELRIITSAHASGASLVGFFPSGASGAVLTSIGNAAVPVFATSAAGLSSKLISSTRSIADASGDVSYTGVGFTPTAIIVIASVESIDSLAIGFSDSSKAEGTIEQGFDGNAYGDADKLLDMTTASGAGQSAIVKTYDADGFTLTWTKAGADTGTIKLFFLCFR